MQGHTWYYVSPTKDIQHPYQAVQKVGDDFRRDPDAHKAHVVATTRNVRGYLGIEQVEVRWESVSSGVGPVGAQK